MAKTKAAHHRGSHQVRARRVTQAAYANPLTRCMSCSRTLDEIRAENPKAFWTGGHVIDGMENGPLLPECSRCNFRRGAQLGNQRRKRTRLTW